MEDRSEEEEAEILVWSAIAVEASETAEDEVQDLKEQLETANAKMTRLEGQLQGLTEAKLNYENELLQKFADLLNSKKMKIRDQQRMLAGAKVDPSTGTCPLIYCFTRQPFGRADFDLQLILLHEQGPLLLLLVPVRQTYLFVGPREGQTKRPRRMI